ncbi:hypothetical protein ACSLBF_16755 [Pseudoalteromonas sp. T1lg65]|uniref:hypothetical protein n=1 Tax=Pseudoalteromonas sp. T1lg65 TaxID=2077101 RepID=UPI003F7A2EC5
MKLKLNKKNMKGLSKDRAVLPSDVTPKVGGAWDPNWTQPAWRCMSYLGCISNRDHC